MTKSDLHATHDNTRTDTATLSSRLFGFSKDRLLWSLLAVSMLPLAFMGYATYSSAAKAIEGQSLRKLQTVNKITAKAVDNYFSSMEEQLKITAENRMTLEALEAFTNGFQKIESDDNLTESSTEDARKSLSTYYTGEFSNEYMKQNENAPPTTSFLENLSDSSAYLQYLYIRKNENPLGSKELLNAADDGSSYSAAHSLYHPIFRNFLKRLQIYDFFLVDADSGTIVYSVFKELDFVTSLKTGSFAGTNFARAFQESISGGRRDTVSFADFENYLPSYEAPASFIAAPIYNGRELKGAVIFQLPVDKITSIISETTGMGETGETYAVADDGLFRSQSRFPEDLGVKSTIINPRVRVDTDAVRSALDDGESGTAEILDYRGIDVLSSWQPVTIHQDSRGGDKNVTWALISEIDRAEILQPVRSLFNFATTIIILSTIGVLLVSVSISHRFSREARRQASLVNGIVDNTNALAGSSEELTSVSQQMSATAEETTAQANLVSSAAEQVSGNTKLVSSSVENLVLNIDEIARSAQDAAAVARQSVDMAHKTSAAMDELGQSSSQIGQVIKVITTIAEQTNLLALNATIEAARAGDMGKGFAVVANEVKELARETAKATEDIGTKIEAMQSDTEKAVTAISEIASVIEKIDLLQTKIATAVEEQSATTSEISRNIGEATTGSTEIAQNIVQVAHAAQNTAEGANNTQHSAQELSHMAQGLQRLVDEYRR
jgi:methyl-accepting chemotaxis protein